MAGRVCDLGLETALQRWQDGRGMRNPHDFRSIESNAAIGRYREERQSRQATERAFAFTSARPTSGLTFCARRDVGPRGEGRTALTPVVLASHSDETSPPRQEELWDIRTHPWLPVGARLVGRLIPWRCCSRPPT